MIADQLRSFAPCRLTRLATTRTGVVVLTTAATMMIRTVSSVLLTRLLAPKDFGIVGIISTFLYALTMVTDLGFQSFIVRHERAEDRHFLNAIWTIHASRGVGLTLIAAAASPVVAWLLGKPQMILPLAVSSAFFLLNGLASLSLMTALRHDGARKLSLMDLGLQVFQTCSCLLLAFWWRSAWAMIATMLLQCAVRSFISYTMFPGAQQRPVRDAEISREFLAFSKVIVVTSALTFVLLQTDKLVLARLFTLSQFGLYSIALSLASAPGAFADAYTTRVVYPVYAQAWRTTPEALASVYYAVRRWASLLYACGCGAVIGGAHLLIAILYDPRYAGAATWLSLLAISFALRLPNFAAVQLMLAIGQIKQTLRANLVRLAWLVVTMPLGYWQFGALGIVASVGLIEAPAMLYCSVVLRRAGVLDIREETLFLTVLALTAAVTYFIAAAILAWFPHI